MKKSSFLFLLTIVLFSCAKESLSTASDPATGDFIQYTIPQGSHYSDKSTFRQVDKREIRFLVRFDSSAIYTSADPVNQYDINKLYGFSDNNSGHHQFSARMGWRWSDGALRLFAYVYNNGVSSAEELSAVPIGSDISCAISAQDGLYVFTVNDVTRTLPRAAGSGAARGYQLYPYFGGDETAPHEIRIWIRDLP